MGVPTDTVNSVKTYSDGRSEGSTFGQSATDKISFYNATPVAQRTSTVQAALTLTTATSGGFGFSTSAAFASFTATLAEIQATLTALGLWKGS